MPFAILSEIDRNKLRYNGIGPRDHKQEGQIWPRDLLDPDDECRKIFHPGVMKLVKNDDRCFSDAKVLVRHVIDAFRQCNIQELYNKTCPLSRPFFDGTPFEIHHALDAYSDPEEVQTLIDLTLKSVNRYRALFNNNDVLKFLFGSYKNRDIFRNNVRWLIEGNSRLRRQTVASFLEQGGTFVDLEKVSWLRLDLPKEVREEVFVQMIAAVIRFITETIRRYFHITVSNRHSHKLFYYRYDLWQKIQSHAIERLIEQEILFRFKLDDTVHLHENSTSKMKFHLKKDGLRLICTRVKDNKNKFTTTFYQLRAVLHFVLSKTPNFEWFRLDSLLQGLKQLKKGPGNDRQFYFVKADLKDCFQSIQQEKLILIIESVLLSQFKDGELEFYNLDCTLKKLKSARRSQRSIKMCTLSPKSVMTSGDYEHVEQVGKVKIPIEEFSRNFLRPQIVNPILRESRTSIFAYNLAKGIRQGCSFSPLLCSIYLQSALNEYLSDVYVSEDCKIYRHVDDLLFISTDIDKSRRFMHCMLKGFKEFGLRANLGKVECNFRFEGIDPALYKDRKYISFFRRQIDVDKLHCRYEYNYHDVTLEQTLYVSPHMDEDKVISALQKSSRIELIHLDCALNQFDQMLLNIYEHVLLAAHRAATLILCSFKLRKLERQNKKLVIDLIDLITMRIYSTIKLGSRKGLIENCLSKLGVRLIVIGAFLSTWERSKIRHRTIELDRIKKEWPRSCWPYLVLNTEDLDSSMEVSGLHLQAKVNQFRKAFPESDFAMTVLLPER